MNFSAPFIGRPVATILLSIGLFLSGAVAYRFLPVAALPSIDVPYIVVIAARPGADPETMANSVAAPLERRLGEIAGITEITSTSSIGNTSVVLQFDISRDINGAAHDVQAPALGACRLAQDRMDRGATFAAHDLRRVGGRRIVRGPRGSGVAGGGGSGKRRAVLQPLDGPGPVQRDREGGG